MALLAEARVKERSTASDLCFPKKYHPRLLIRQGNVGLPFPLGEHIQLISTVALPPNLHASPLLPASPKTNISSRCLALGILIETIYFPALGSSVSLAAVCALSFCCPRRISIGPTLHHSRYSSSPRSA